MQNMRTTCGVETNERAATFFFNGIKELFVLGFMNRTWWEFWGEQVAIIIIIVLREVWTTLRELEQLPSCSPSIALLSTTVKPSKYHHLAHYIKKKMLDLNHFHSVPLFPGLTTTYFQFSRNIYFRRRELSMESGKSRLEVFKVTTSPHGS